MKATVTLWAFTPKGESGLTWLVAQAICLWTRSDWFHVGVSVDGCFYEARPFCGVMDRYNVPHDAVKVRSWEVDYDETVEKWIHRQLGKPYDWPGIFGFIFGPSKGGRADRGKWFCSELASVVLRKLGVDVCMCSRGEPWRWQHVPAWEVTPGKLVQECSRP